MRNTISLVQRTDGQCYGHEPNNGQCIRDDNKNKQLNKLIFNHFSMLGSSGRLCVCLCDFFLFGHFSIIFPRSHSSIVFQLLPFFSNYLLSDKICFEGDSKLNVIVHGRKKKKSRRPRGHARKIKVTAFEHSEQKLTMAKLKATHRLNVGFVATAEHWH